MADAKLTEKKVAEPAKKAAPKTTVKKTAEKTIEKAAEKATEKVVEKAAEKTAKKAAEPTVKKAVEPTAKKAPEPKAKAPEPKTTVTVQYAGQDIQVKTILAQVKRVFKKDNKGVEIKKIDLYIKPEENAVYYVVNGKASEEYKIVLSQ